MSIPSRHHHTPTQLKEFLFGSEYYPEHWEEGIRASDPELFRAAGWNVIRMGDFAWDVMEPQEGHFDFRLFDETIARFAAVGIRTIMCTPTAAPPRWLTSAFPEVLRVDDSGRVLCHGSRQHAGHFSEVFREYSRKITRALATHFAENPHVIGWQTDNEIHCHFSEDHSPEAERAFVLYLKERYLEIERLNRAWGTAFWAQTYRSFEEIPTPRPGRPTHLNPAHVLDYQRFLAHGAAVFQHDQVEILRAANPTWWITHNGTFRHVDYAGAFGNDLDFLGFDSYPMFDPDPASRQFSQAFNTDHARAFCGNFLILEQQSGPGSQGNYLLDTPEPGEMRKLAWVNIARGADGLLLFRERSCRFGAEEYWCGVLDHDNVPRRRYREAAQLGAELAAIGNRLLGTSVEISVGIATGDFDAQHGHEPITFGLPSPKNAAETIHHCLTKHGYPVGCVHPGSPLHGITAFFVPHMAVFDPVWVPAWESWVREGGVLVIGARTATKDLHGNVVAETIPGALRDLVGATVEEYGRQNHPASRPRPIRFAQEAHSVPTDLWYECIQPDEGTTVAAIWTTRHLKDQAAVTLRPLGRGAVLYVGTYFTAPIVEALLPVLQKLGAMQPSPGHVPGVEQVVRSSEKTRFRFYINHNEEAVQVPTVAPGLDILSSTEITTALQLEPNGVAIVQEA